MKVVFDTNVLVSAFVFGGTSGKTLEFCIEYHEIYISAWIKNELNKILFSKFNIPQSEIIAINSLIDSGFTTINPTTPLPLICRDKDDNNILQLAESANAHYIITGDKDLLILKQYGRTKIAKPSEFLTLVKL